MVLDKETWTYGYANLNGDIIASCIYELSEDIEIMMNNDLVTISDGLAMLIIGGRYGFINSSGEIIIPLNYIGAIPFKDGLGYVQTMDGKWKEIKK
ncbi:MAG: WG repeat-containing protein [Bacteroidales bacterium]|nr:WG repeat-containing protein [Bacteroidales bacterium]